MCDFCQTRALLDHFLGTVQGLIDLDGMGCLPKHVLEFAYQLVAAPATDLRELLQREIVFHLCANQVTHGVQSMCVSALLHQF